MPEQGLFEFTVPDELLKEAVSKHRDREVVADLELVPGTGEGKPPSIWGILRKSGFSPLLLFTAAALVSSTFGAGIGLLGPNIQRAFHLSDTGLAATAFVVNVAQVAWAIPVAVAADRGSRKVVAGVTLLIFAVVAPLMALARNVWPFVFLYMAAAVAYGTNQTVHNSYLADAYPTEARARVFSYHYAADPVSSTLGIFVVGLIATAGGSWRWGLVIALLGIPIGVAILFLREPDKGANESSHILKAAGMDVSSQQQAAPRVLLGSAVNRLLKIRSLYYQLVAVAVLGFVSLGTSVFGSLYLERVWHQGIGQRGHVYLVTGLSTFLGIPLSYAIGDRLFRRAPQAPLLLAGASLVLYGLFFSGALYMPRLWLVELGWFLANAAIAPIAISIFQTLAATAPPEMRSICFGLFGFHGLVFGGFTGAVLLGAISEAIGVKGALALMGPVSALGGVLLMVGSRFVRRDITLVIEDVLERYAEGKRRQSGAEIPALQIHNLDFSYGNQQVLFDVNLEVRQGEVVALLGTNGAGKSTLLRAVAGLEHPTRGVIRLFGANTTYLEAEQVLDLGVALLVGGKMTFPGLSVRDNLRVGGYSLRRHALRHKAALERALQMFPELEPRLDQAAGTLSGGEQQMLALARVTMTEPRLLMIDELTLGLAPMTVERLMEIVRQINARGTTVVLVEQSVNRAMSLAARAVFLERGQVRFDGPTSELLRRDDLLRPVFLASAQAGLG
ncbi:MAG TPA: ATP-binding protein [Acidimicrobiales bacterium]|nr:ATP-binding protein [Acidimicrobiales bacterium]